MSDFSVGDVGVGTFMASRRRVMRTKTGWYVADPERVDWQWTGDGAVPELQVTDVRPLVVLDCGPATVAQNVALVLRDAKFDAIARQIEEQVGAYPAEPTGLGAVVEDRSGSHWVRLSVHPKNPPWTNPNSFDKDWDQLDVVRVLSEGV